MSIVLRMVTCTTRECCQLRVVSSAERGSDVLEGKPEKGWKEKYFEKQPNPINTMHPPATSRRNVRASIATPYHPKPLLHPSP